MSIVRAAVTIAVVALSGCGSPSPADESRPPAETSNAPVAPPVAPSIPFEDPGACPFEGCTYREWTANQAVDVLAERRDGSAVAFTVAPGERVTALTGVVVITKPGRVTFATPTELPGTPGPLRMAAGETMYLLTPEGEGHFTVWVHGQVVEGVDGGVGQLVDRVEYVWWVQVRNASGLTGWTRMPERFDGKDRLA